jgi:GNAT superfamily N-acetyltransferase
MRFQMKVVYVDSKKDQKIYFSLFKKIYKNNNYARNANNYMLKQIFKGKTAFCKDKYIRGIYILENKDIVMQCVFIHSDKLDALQIAYFEALPEKHGAFDMLMKEAIKICNERKIGKIVAGMNGHVNYGLGFLIDSFDKDPVFGTQYNPPYYKSYFERYNMKEIRLCSFYWDMNLVKMQKYTRIYEKLRSRYIIKEFNPNNLDEEARLYTYLNHVCFKNHRFYYPSSYEEDKVLVKELLLLSPKNFIVFAYDGAKPIGFVLWYPDFNQLIKPGRKINVLTLIKIQLFKRRITKVKVGEIGVIPEYHNKGIPLLLLKYIADKVKDKYTCGESSWILEENKSSRLMTSTFADKEYKHYAAYEMDVKNED